MNTVPADIAHQLAENERMLIRAWDLQRRNRSAPHAEPVTDDQVDRAATLLEQIVDKLPSDEREDVAKLISIVRTRLELKAEQG
ncbi:hypothetical protein [Devosia aurantiaca]|uniref:Uncharacterized protein n=1 Tax=Devosia aurantiaca TaxID=2714858 RepID=A0A6M1SBN6_9HYPH|nr:hypothetical protein [Devosia aurantiaca]NGP17359.1 hypothetical protein [Devosia aurantiaca]